jgi:hypothetical protein
LIIINLLGLEWRGEVTGPIARAGAPVAQARAVRVALERLASVGPGGVRVAAAPAVRAGGVATLLVAFGRGRRREDRWALLVPIDLGRPVATMTVEQATGDDSDG